MCWRGGGVCGITSCATWACAGAPAAARAAAVRDRVWMGSRGSPVTLLGAMVVRARQVRAIDAAKRAWGDKDEWKSTLTTLAANGKLEYIKDSDEVKFKLPAEI